MSFLAILMLAVAVGAQVPDTGFSPYLGLAVPIPAEVPLIKLKKPGWRGASEPAPVVHLWVGHDGRPDKIVFGADSADYPESLREVRKKIRFRFLSGTELAFPVKVPVRLAVVASREPRAMLVFPIDSLLQSDEALLAEFFALNQVEPPSVTMIPPVVYKTDSKQAPEYVTITAQVTLDGTGNLVDLKFPIAGQDNFTHQVLVALINSRFKPASLAGRFIPSEFLLTFRIFDNIKYPFSPIDLPDTILPSSAERYFMIPAYSMGDIEILPLPCGQGGGRIKSARYGPLFNGDYTLSIGINADGQVRWVTAGDDNSGLIKTCKKILKKTTWYPAIDNKGRRRHFAGKVTLRFNQTDEIVCIPEWLTR